MDQITVGLDFGTHQTKICIQTVPDEGHGEPRYEFFQFKDLEGNNSYFLPSVIQVNADNTLSYGFVDRTKEKSDRQAPSQDAIKEYLDIDINGESERLFRKYAYSEEKTESIAVLKTMLTKVNLLNKQKHTEQINAAKTQFSQALKEYNKHRRYYEYFKQASFTDYVWEADISCDLLSTWYLAYVLFLLEDQYGDNFSVNMGIPADTDTYREKKQHALDLLATAFDLVENVFNNDKQLFLSKTLDEMLSLTKPLYFVKKKDYYFIKIFPEAYASLVTLTSRGKLAEKLSLTADIGGGTTDISFFMVRDGKPLIYRYWSLPHGLNFLAEKSGFNYREADFKKKVSLAALVEYRDELMAVHSELRKALIKDFRERSNDISKLNNALRNRAIVYNGGGSCFSVLTKQIGDFSDVKCIEPSMWREENIVNKAQVSPLCKLLTIAYGLSLSRNENDVALCDFSTLFHNWVKEDKQIRTIDKDMV